MLDVRRPQDIMKDIKRGNSKKFLREQKIPQASWEDPEAILNHKPMHFDPENPRGMILLGALGRVLLGVLPDRHLYTCAGNRSGKTTTVEATMMFSNNSFFMVDGKMVSANRLAYRRYKLGQKVGIFDPYDLAKGKARQFRVRYNPLTVLNIDSPGVIEEAMTIVDGMIESSPHVKDPHWDETAGEGILSLILFVAFASNVKDENRNLITVRKMISKMRKVEQDAEGKGYYVVLKYVRTGIKKLKEGQYSDIAEVIEEGIEGFYERAPDEMAGVLSTMKRHTSFLNTRAMKYFLSGHDIDLNELKRAKNGCTIFVGVPATKMKSNSRFFRILVNQLTEMAEKEPTRRNAPPVIAVLDEFNIFGRLKILENAIGQAASMGVLYWIIAQDDNQGRSNYNDKWDTFLANMQFHQYFANVDFPTCEKVSKKLGKTPVETIRNSDTSAKQRGDGQMGVSRSVELYDMLTPNEVELTFSRDDPMHRQLLFPAGGKPQIIQRILFYDETKPYHHIFKGKWEQHD
jgi:type IV secretion system protein VirD4